MCLRTPREDGADPPAKNPKLMNLMEWIPGNTNDAPSERAWGIQGSGGATEAPVTQLVHKGKRMRIQRNQKWKVSYHAPSNNKIPQADARGAG